MFTADKVAQMAAFFAEQQGGTINVLKLMKLLYLADRESMNQFGAPISFDYMVSMDQGPVLSRALNLINGDATDEASAKWDEWIHERKHHDVSLKRAFSRDDLDQLSDADMSVLNVVWKQFGGMDKWALRDYTHKHCPEWQDPHGSSIGIDEEKVFSALGKLPEAAKELSARIKAERELDRVFERI